MCPRPRGGPSGRGVRREEHENRSSATGGGSLAPGQPGGTGRHPSRRHCYRRRGHLSAEHDRAVESRLQEGDFVYLPETAGGIAVIYKVAGFTGLKLSGPTLAKIFAGTITNWND